MNRENIYTVKTKQHYLQMSILDINQNRKLDINQNRKNKTRNHTISEFLEFYKNTD